MCGIVGFVARDKNENVLERMLQVQRYRGPDDRGTFIEKMDENYLHLGHNRLSIQDLSSHGHQPFISDCGNYAIVYNGEVYNFKAIRKELEELGYRFVSHSDTEVILYAYKAWGMGCLEKFIGMFAFAILDRFEHKIFLVRDRAGVKPLYYYVGGKTFMFASELKSFHQHSAFIKALNKEILPYYFQFGYIPAPHTIFEDTYKLEPGNYLEFDIKNATFSITQYWDVNACYEQEKFDVGEKEILDDLEDLLSDAVELRMVSDVPVGVFLSGGYDSSLVTALLSKNTQRRLHTFTIGFEEKGYNEAAHAKAVAKHLGTEHTEYYVSQNDMLQKIEMLPFLYDEPFGDSSALPTIMLSELAKKDVTVALSADGGDEAFCGYSKYFFLKQFETIFAHPFKKRLLKGALRVLSEERVARVNALLPDRLTQTNIKDKYHKFKRAMDTDSPEEMFVKASSYVDPSLVSRLLKVDPHDDLLKRFSMRKGPDLLDEMMRIDYQTFMVDDVLTKVDRATMSISLEGREPLLDHRIIEYMARVPSALKYKNGQGKYLVREILYKYIPLKLVDKPKAGFQIPLEQWLRSDLKPMVEKYLDVSRMDDEIFDLFEVERIKDEFFSGQTRHMNLIWFILMYEMWKEKWFK